MKGRMLIYLSAAALIGCTAPKMQKPSPAPLTKKAPLSDVQNNGRKLTSRFSNGTCKVDAEIGEVTYKFDNGNEFSFHVLPLNFVGNVISLHCFDEKTITVTSKTVVVTNKGHSGGAKSEYSDVYGDDAIDTDVLVPASGVENIASLCSGDYLFVLMKNHEKNTTEMMVVDTKNQYYDAFEIGNGNSNMKVFSYNEIIFVAREAKKGEQHIVFMKMEDTLMGSDFTAPKDVQGEISFEEKQDHLLVKIGDYEAKITIEKSAKKDDSCFDGLGCVAIKE